LTQHLLVSILPSFSQLCRHILNLTFISIHVQSRQNRSVPFSRNFYFKTVRSLLKIGRHFVLCPL
jgi:hypothetical protein